MHTPRRNRRYFIAILAATALSPVALADTIDVFVFNFDFSTSAPGQPIKDAIVEVGDSVRWVWADGNHTTTSVAGIPEQWDAKIDSGNTVFTHTFTQVGIWHYYCKPHGVDNGNQTAGGMAGTVTVVAAGSGACCLPNGTCEVLSHASCLRQGGTYQGNGSTCSPNPCPNQPVTLAAPADLDNILYESALGDVSNALGNHLYAGNQNSGLRRRPVVRFDLSGVPAGAQVQSATLQLRCNSSSGVAFPVTAHRVLASWGEGTSKAGGNEGSGTAATPGDATWLHRFYDTTFWAGAGGDFVTTPSASASVAATGIHSWTGAGLAGDVQMWIDMPQHNFGWLLRGDEASSSNTKRFDSRHNSTPANRPTLLVTYVLGTEGACCLPDGTCVSVLESACVGQGGIFQGGGVACGQVSCPVQLEPFVDALPRPAVAQPVVGQPGGAAHYELAMTEQKQKLHRDLPETVVWGYQGSYPGPTIEARRDLPVTVVWKNDLRDVNTGQLRTTHYLPVDTCPHGPNMFGDVPVGVVHLHGGHVPQSSDGYPEDYFPPGSQSALYTYPNAQPAGTIWYHDHALGITRLNVYMGMAGFYLIRDAAEEALGLPAGEFEVPMAIQDRSFKPDGTLEYPELWHEHFFGDVVLVNGKVWPYLEVKKGKYRLRLLNGSGSRTYTLALSNGATFWQIGTDTGLMAAPVPLTALTISPGERADVVMDFAPYAAGTEIILTNSAPAPFPGNAGVGVIPEVMKFIVGSATGHTGALPGTLVNVPTMEESSAALQRDFVLKQFPNPCSAHHDPIWLINGMEWHHVTEYPRLDTTEIWAWWNSSAVTHPMHMHLVSFQVLDRQEFDPVTNTPIGPRVPPAANEIGWKDTVQATPGQITRVIARFENYLGKFSYHCHILEHEDHEMMRQFQTTCYANCDMSTSSPVLNVADFGCFLQQFAAGNAYANCDGSTTAPVLNVADFGCFLTRFAAGCQ